MTTVEPRAELAATPQPVGRGLGFAVRQYVALTKPRIIELLLITTVPVMFLAAGGVPPLGLVLATLVGGTLAAGAANTFNCVIDRDIDAVMHRTSTRPMVTGAVTPRAGVAFGAVLTVVSTLVLGMFVNWLSAALAVLAVAFYVGVYTVLLKRRTSQNIVWGGAAGCMPTLIGWSSVTGRLSWAALVLFLVVFLWTPPHYWPLSMKFREDYRAARVPMLPAVTGVVTVARQVLVYSWLMVAASLVLVPVAAMGWVYTVAAVLAGGLFLAEAHRLHHHAVLGSSSAVLRPMRLFHYSITYLSVLFVAVAVDPLLHWPVLG